MSVLTPRGRHRASDTPRTSQSGLDWFTETGTVLMD
ncbi:hypothetical protein PybrP1_005153 [[Pythium] brassicae (nom. inval.)]|nr:hypothetical protein PybrP1_005153 [[Pythium] brassicae (nom. inval.)]